MPHDLNYSYVKLNEPVPAPKIRPMNDVRTTPLWVFALAGLGMAVLLVVML